MLPRSSWFLVPALMLLGACSLLAPSDAELGGGVASGGGMVALGGGGVASNQGGSGPGGAGGGGGAETCEVAEDVTLDGTASLVFRSYFDMAYAVPAGGEGVCDVVSGTLLPLSSAEGFALDPTPAAGALRWRTFSDGAALGEGLTLLRERLHGAVQLTLELVVDVVALDLGSDSQASQLVHLGDQTNLLTLAVVGTSGDVIYGLGDGRAFWQDLDITTEGRVVLHVTYDASATLEEERGQLFIDGVAAPPSLPLGLEGAVALPESSLLYVGATPEVRSIEGAIHYVAIYDDLLLPSQIATNVARLSSDDDRP